jgi:hypothetical protein
MMLPSSARAEMTALPKVDTNCTAPPLIPTVNGNTVLSFSTHGHQSAAKGSATAASRSDIRLIQHLDSSALGLVRRWRLTGHFLIHLVHPSRGGPLHPRGFGRSTVWHWGVGWWGCGGVFCLVLVPVVVLELRLRDARVASRRNPACLSFVFTCGSSASLRLPCSGARPPPSRRNPACLSFHLRQQCVLEAAVQRR